MRHWTKLLTLALLAGLAFACQKEDNLLLLETPSPRLTETPPDQIAAVNNRKKAVMYTAELSALNNSGVSGTATLTVGDGLLTVEITATGLEPDRVHAQHIHGAPDNNGNATCPPPDADTDGDGLISVVEGLPFYGPVLLGLAPFPTADANGNVYYSRTFANVLGDVSPLQNRAIVLHGLSVNGAYVGSLPVACGQISPPMPVN